MDFTPASGASKIHATPKEHPAPEGAKLHPNQGQGGTPLPTDAEPPKGAKSPQGERVELFEYSPEPEGFFRKAFFRARIEKVEIGEKNGEKIALINADNTNKKIILQNIGRLKKIKELAKRNYGIEEVRVR